MTHKSDTARGPLAQSRLSQPSDAAASKWMRPEATAEYAGLSASYLAKLRVLGRGPSYRKIGRSVIYRQSDVDAWLDANARASTSDIGGAK
jgi:predicted DNA-binding transcriptional regulator AlpA